MFCNSTGEAKREKTNKYQSKSPLKNPRTAKTPIRKPKCNIFNICCKP